MTATRLLCFSSGRARLPRQVGYHGDRELFVTALGRGTWDFAPGIQARHEIPSVGTSGTGLGHTNTNHPL